MSPRTVDVLLPLGLDAAYSYLVPDGMRLAPGDLVHVPLATKSVIGVVWSEAGPPKAVDTAKLKAVKARLDYAPLPPDLMTLIDWMADYTLAPRGMVLRMALRHGEAPGAGRERVGVRATGARPERMTAARERLLALVADGFVRGKSEAAREAGVSPSVVDGLMDDGALEAVVLPPEPAAYPPDPDHAAVSLSEAQAEAAEVLRTAVDAHAFAVHLLDGVTGSGKTEVYFEAVAEAIRQGRQALILLPEIALTQAFLERFSARFGVKPAEWHSGVSTRRRARILNEVASGAVKVVAGARSALFLPFRDLGLVIVDEEHDPAYKQEDGVAYNARDMAVVRARLAACPIVLASATPSIETEVNARRGRYKRLALPLRFGGAKVPALTPIDLRKEGPPRGRWIAPRLEAEVNDTLEAGGQALLFLNRRGYAPLTLCRSCGHRMRCPSCTAWLVEHRYRRRLTCHHCGYQAPVPEACPACGEKDSLVPVGPGVERLQEEVNALFPAARTLVLSSDLLGGVERMRAELDAVAKGEVDVVVGTQLVAKGHNFPGLALVGVVDADVGLGHGDPRAAERTFQLVHQVAGRAGRGAAEGRGFVQTHMPEHPVMRALVKGDRAAFYESEIAARQEAMLPPFGRMASLVVSASEALAAEAHARRLAACAPITPEVRILGPAEAPLAVLRGRHRWRLLARSPRGFDLSAYLRAWRDVAPRPKGNVRVAIDVDPQSFL
ncbi:primosomal protein N' [Xanthobacter tagetidis]|uniref:Replication restart protein PriA n=1 Tax=Xanthobacter tagetidis TaxID=60216 RepID=A0A3L7AE69_9HYPH|nr:primosomal protein N' [Xanthobacter tagetidis]MBB6308450.1 primosomal protein N' (replication factor Y) [Xanthobacter tagetidis]RLP78766.1 primosomal protein N' [Xanthobacter tagetidis]